MDRISSSAAGYQTATPLQAPQPQHHQSSSGAPPPRPRVDIRADIRTSLLELDNKKFSSDFSKHVAILLASEQQAVARFTRLINGIDEDHEIDPRTRIDMLSPTIRQACTPQMFVLSPEVLASCLVLLEPGTEGTDPASNASTASTATSSDLRGANRDNSAV